MKNKDIPQAAMTELGPGTRHTGDTAKTLKVQVALLRPARAKLMNKGMIYA